VAKIDNISRNNISISVLGFMEGIIEYKRNLKNLIKLIEDESSEFNEIEKIKAINLDNFIKKNTALKERFGKKTININVGDTIKVKILKYYVKVNKKPFFICDLDNDNFEIIH